MRNTIAKSLITVFVFLNMILLTGINTKTSFAREKNNYWEIQSVDTMKYSRDLARERNGDKVFEIIIETYTEKIASTGATHVAIGTPYDEEFIPFMEKWVSAARRAGLNVWFRGNFSGWEGWFEYSALTKEEHTIKIEDFIINNPNLFEDGDIFTTCTECENGVMGDPRLTGDILGYREFLINEYNVAKNAYGQIGINVNPGYFSMNADVARIIMDEETTNKLGGIVVIDHYVKDPSQLADDVRMISEKSGGKVILGEFGAPIPDIHGEMTDEEQSRWISDVLSQLSKEQVLLGLNYWVSFGGTTAIWNIDGTEKSAVEVIREYYSPNVLSGKVINELGQPVENALVIADSKESYTDDKGEFKITSNPSLERIVINSQTYKEMVSDFNGDINLENIIMEKEKEGFVFKLRKFFYITYQKIKNR